MDSSEYVRRVLDAYRATPGTCGAIRQPDRVFALQLFAVDGAHAVQLEIAEQLFEFFGHSPVSSSKKKSRWTRRRIMRSTRSRS